nr:transposase, MuDR, MULE transposase domain protein [Tanacetum cinerariifolium]
MKFFIEQQIAKTSRFINVMREQVQSSRNRLTQLNDMISKIEAMNDPEEFYDALFCLRDDKRDEYNTLIAINDLVVEAEEKLTTIKAHLEITKAEINPDGFTGQLANLHLDDLYNGLDLEMHLQFVFADDMPIMDEVVFKIHKNGYFEFDPLRGYYLINMVWVEEDAALRCSSSSPFSTRIKKKGGKITKKGLRKKEKGKHKMVDDELVGRKSIKTSRKGKEIMYEFPGPSSTKESHVSVTNYKRAIVNGKAKVVEVEDVDVVQPVGSATKMSFVQESTSTETSKDCSGSTKSFSSPIYGYFARTNELPENCCLFEVNYDGVFNEYPLSLEEGLTIVKGDGDMNKLYDIAKKYGLINLYNGHLPKNLAEYYYKNLTLDASDEEVKSKLKTHEKRKLDACSMCPHKLVEWEKQEAGPPYLRTPPLKPRRKGIDFPC